MSTITGYYAYAEASFPRQKDDRAQLLSPRLTGDYCLQFYFHMFGPQMGKLHIFVLAGAQRTALGSYSGNRGERWYKTKADIGSIQPYQVKICNRGLSQNLSR